MAHPYFGVLRFPKDRPEARRLHRALVDLVTNPNEIEDIYEDCGDLRPLMLLQPPDLIWNDVLQNLTGGSALKKFFEVILGLFNNVILRDIITEIENAVAVSQERIISDDILILDRVVLRQHLELLEAEMNPVKVLLVRGGPKSGKSYGRHLFERVAFSQGAQPLYLCVPLVATVDDVVMELFSALGASKEIPPRGDTTDEAWYQSVCRKLQELAISQNRSLWVAVDDLGPDLDGVPLLDPQIRKFCDQFALNMLNPSFRKWFRLMLIHYPDGRVPTRWKREFWSEDRTNDADVQQADVEDVLRAWLVTNDRKMVEDELTALAGKVVAKAEIPLAPDPNGEPAPPRLQRIHDALTETLRDLAEASL